MNKKIVIIEDDAWLAEQHARVLKNAGYSPHIAPHAIAGIELIDAVHPGAIIVDVLLTGSTAFTLLHELQSHDDIGTIPIIVCSSVALEIDSAYLSAYGVRRTLDKTTMQPDDIVTAVRSVLL